MRRFMAYSWQREFAQNLSHAVSSPVTVRDLRDRIARLPDGDMPGDDGAKRFNLTLARSLHAAVALLEQDRGMASPDAVRIAGAAFGESGTWFARAAIRLWLRLESDPFAGVSKRGPSSVARAMWGNGMAVADKHAAGEVSLCVAACPFHDYFWNVGRTDLTPILCAWDTAWQAEVNASSKAIRVDIRGTIAGGAEVCEFAFRKTDPTGAG